MDKTKTSLFDNNEREYTVCGVKFVVSSQFAKSNETTINKRIERVIENNFIPLTIEDNLDKIPDVYMYSNAGKEA